MKIGDFSGRAIAGTGSTAAALRSEAQPANRTAAGGSDRIQLSNLSAYLAAAQSGSPTHAGKITSLTRAVSAGEYQVDPAVLSTSIVQDSLRYSGANRL